MGTTVYGASLIASTLVGYLPDLYLAAIDYEPNANSDGTTISEPTDSAYIRQQIVMSVAYWSSVYNGKTYYLPEVSFPVATEYWNGIAYWGLCTASIGGSLVLWGSFSPSGTIPTGQHLVVPAETIGMYVGTG